MKVKKYVAKTMQEAMKEIKKELGPDAVILNSKEIKSGGILGLFQQKSMEVIAAIDKEPTLPKKGSKQVITRQDNMTKQAEQSQVLDEIKHLKELLATQSFQSENNFPPVYENAFKYLLEQEVSDTLALEIMQSIVKKGKEDEHVTKVQMKELLNEEIEKRLAHVSFKGISEAKRIIQFVGPTGVGKTTTLAKVAALSMLEHRKKIAFITTDTYRIAAIEQLKTYARILDVPVEVAYSVEDYERALQTFAHFDYIFVDTAGRNFRDERYVQELKNMLDFKKDQVETYLVLSLTAKKTDIMDIYHQFTWLPVEKVIFTKMDETLTFGSILNIGASENIDIAYITNGQDVPDDLVKPNKQKVSQLILSRYANV